MRRALAVLAVLATLGASALAAAGAGAASRPMWDTRVLAPIPAPGFPANAYVSPGGRVYEGTYDNPSGDHVPSKVLEFSDTGAPLASWTVQGQDLAGPHGVQVATSDARGRLVLLDKAPPRVLTLDRRTGEQRLYADFPSAATPNHAAWGPDGSLYVTDYEHPVLWRVPPGGGTARPWLRSPVFDGGPFGMTGIALRADHRTLVVGMQSETGLAAGDPATGRLWTVDIRPDGTPGPPRQLWESRPLDGPDAFAIARDGTIYVALLLTNQLAAIRPDGREEDRFPGVPVTGANGSPVPFDNPSSVHFLGERVVVANQSYLLGDASHQVVLDVQVGEPGLPELIPSSAGRAVAPAPARSHPHRRHAHRHHHGMRGSRP